MKTAAPKFHYQWQQNIANLGRRKRATTDEEGVNIFLEVRPRSVVKRILLSSFQSISAVDKSDCGKLYLCEISATPRSKLLREDQNTLDLLRRTYSQVGILGSASLIIKLFTNSFLEIETGDAGEKAI